MHELAEMIRKQNTNSYAAEDIAIVPNKAQLWFDAVDECYSWYKNSPLVSFYNLTPAQVVDSLGIDALNQYI